MKAIINVRLGSTRLPGKVLMNICGKPALQHLIERVKKSKYIKEVIINTTTKPRDNKIVEFCMKNNYSYNRGSEDDVTSRITSAIHAYKIDEFVEIYGDCPLADHRIIDSAIDYFKTKNLDFYGNDLKTTFPPGFEVEIVKSKAFLKSDLLCDDPEIREHGTLFIRLNPDIFSIQNFEYINTYNFIPHLTLDTQEDFELITTIFEYFYSKSHLDFSIDDVMKFLDSNKDLLKLNHLIERKWKQYRDD